MVVSRDHARAGNFRVERPATDGNQGGAVGGSPTQLSEEQMTLYVRVRGKREKWHPAVYYGIQDWPSACFWMVPGFRVDID